MPPTDAQRRIDALLGATVRLARSAPSGQLVLARLARIIDPAWLAGRHRERFAAELAEARAREPGPLSAREVERALRGAWGVKPGEELDELDLEPVAVTPTAQVHRGVLDGEAVAVKVLRPGIAASVRQDLVLLDGLVAPLGSAFPALDANALIREVRERVQDELDFEHEAEVQRRFHRALRSHPFLTVPAPVTRLSHPTVLVSGWIDGDPILRAPDSEVAAARLIAFVIGAARFGVIHADPDPDDVLVLPDGRVAILDFGATRAVVPERVTQAHAALEAFATDDGVAFAAALKHLGALPKREAKALRELATHALGELAGPGPTRLDTAAVLAVDARLRERRDELARLAVAARLAPEDLWPVRGVVQLFAVLARVGARGDWLELVRAALRDGWDVAGATTPLPYS